MRMNWEREKNTIKIYFMNKKRFFFIKAKLKEKEREVGVLEWGELRGCTAGLFSKYYVNWLVCLKQGLFQSRVPPVPLTQRANLACRLPSPTEHK